MKLIISNWCIAIIKAKSARKITTPIFIHPSKDDLSYLRREEKFQISPLDGAQYAKILFNLKQATRRNNPKYNSKMKLQHTPTVGKIWNANQSSQSHYYSHFNFKTKQTRPSGAVRTAKRTKEALRQIFLSYHHYLMKALDCNINKKKKKKKTTKNHTKTRKKKEK